MECFKPFELSLQGDAPTGSQTEVDLTAVFTNGGERVALKGFYDGDGVYKVRFLPRNTGTWHWEVRGAVNASGEENCTPAAGSHGLVRAEGTHFTFEDGSKYIPFGTTVYALIHQTDEVIRDTFQTLKNAPFNKVRMCVFPKHYDLVKSEPPCFPFERDPSGNWDVHRPNYNFWCRLERCIDALGSLGVQADLILFHPYDRWGFSSMTMEENLIYLDLVIRRLAAYPNLWRSLANEYDLLPARTLEDWYTFEAYLSQHDPYGHLLSCHNCTAAYDFHRANITHVSIQTSWIERVAAWQEEYKKPVIYDEMCYEGNVIFDWGNISGFEMAHRFWAVCSSGGFATHGDTFMDENNIIWWACGGKLKGQSAARIGFLKEILYSLPGPLEPMEQRGLARFENLDEQRLLALREQDEGLYQLASGTLRMEPGLRQALFTKGISYGGHCGEDAYLTYYGRTCPYKADLQLPENKTYVLQVIDIWEMTKTTVLTGVSGTVAVPLPSKEGVAVLAVSEESFNP